MRPRTRWPMSGSQIFDEKVDIEIGLARHFFANSYQDLQEPRPAVHGSTMHQKFGRYYRRREKSGGSVEHTQPCLFADVRDVSKIPGDEIIDLIE